MTDKEVQKLNRRELLQFLLDAQTENEALRRDRSELRKQVRELEEQLEKAEEINNDRLSHWNRYYEALLPLKEKGLIDLPYVPKECVHNAHMFYIKCKDFEERKGLIEYLLANDILPASHYVPLHSSKAGLIYSEFRGEDRYTTKESERLLRLPMYYKLSDEDLDEVVMRVKEYYKFS